MTASCPHCHAPLAQDSASCPACGRDLASRLETVPQIDGVLPSEPNLEWIGEFRILSVLGRGGMGTVHEAWQESMHRKVALKVLHAGAMPSGSEVSRFEREAWIGGRLNHPNIVKVYGQGTAGSTHFIAMELAAGHSLDTEIREARSRRASVGTTDSSSRKERVRRIVSLFVGVADAMHHVHEHGIVHRDIKPHNLLLSEDRTRLLVTDFGLARDEEASRMTRHGDLLGTVRYMSPEQLLAQRVKVDRRTDIWSLGVSLYEAVTLELPFEAASEEAYVSAIATQEPKPARARDRLVPRDLETILLKCLERDPGRRYRTAAELKEDLVRFLEDRPVLARRPGPLLKTIRFGRRHRAALGGAVLAAVVVAGILVLAAHWAGRRKDLERVRWTLDQVIAKNSAPETVEPDWERLQKRLHEEVRRDPSGPLAILALKAASGLSSEVQTYGLLSDLPELEIPHWRRFDPGQEALYVAEVEFSWDRGPWKPLSSLLAQIGSSGSCGYGLGEFLGPDQIVAGPHVLDTRMRLTLLDRATLGGFKVSQEGGGFRCHAKPSELPDPAARKAAEILVETVPLGTHPINLFSEYPENFPLRIADTGNGGAMDSAFTVNRVIVTLVHVPERHGSKVVFRTEDGKDIEMELSGDVPGGSYLLYWLRLVGRFGFTLPAAIAAEAELRLAGAPGPVLKFPLAWSLGTSLLVSRGGEQIHYRERPDDSPFTHWNWRAKKEPRQVLTSAPSAGMTRGRLDLVPSREVAIETRQLDRYLDRRMGFDVEVEVEVVDGR